LLGDVAKSAPLISLKLQSNCERLVTKSYNLEP
jgi:hypothetical protein